jgi:hypothetical protein
MLQLQQVRHREAVKLRTVPVQGVKRKVCKTWLVIQWLILSVKWRNVLGRNFSPYVATMDGNGYKTEGRKLSESTLIKELISYTGPMFCSCSNSRCDMPYVTSGLLNYFPRSLRISQFVLKQRV